MKAEPSSQRVTMADIAREADVSVPAVSMALAGHPRISEATRRRIRNLAESLGYRPPAARRRRGNGGTTASPLRQVGYVVIDDPPTSRVTTYYDLQMQPLSRQALALGMRAEMLWIDRQDGEEEVEEQIRRFAAPLDGMLISGIIEPWVVALLNRLGRPWVGIGGFCRREGEPEPIGGVFVDVDPVHMGCLATGRLLDSGHRRVGFIGDDPLPGLYTAGWLRGYHLAHLERDLPVAPTTAIMVPMVEALGGPLKELLTAELRPDAFVVPNLMFARHLVDVARELGTMALSAGNLCLGGTEQLATTLQLGKFPQLSADPAALASAALQWLEGLPGGSLPGLCQVTIPCQRRNWS